MFDRPGKWRTQWTRRTAFGAALLAGLGGGMAVSAWFPRAQAQGTAAAPPAPTSALAQQILGHGGLPDSISPDTIPADYRLVRVFDTGSRVGFYVTRGDMISSGGQSFLLAYQVNVFTDAAGEQKIARGQDLWLTLINTSSIELIDQIGPVPEASAPPPPARGQE